MIKLGFVYVLAGLMFAGFALVGKQPAPRRRRPAPAPVAYSQKATPA